MGCADHGALTSGVSDYVEHSITYRAWNADAAEPADSRQEKLLPRIRDWPPELAWIRVLSEGSLRRGHCAVLYRA